MKNKIASENPASVHLFYGDEFLVKERVRNLLDKLLDQDLRKTNLIVVDGINLDAQYLTGQVLTPSLFGGPQVILVENTTVFSSRVDQHKILTKTLESWEADDRNSAFRAFGQLLSLVGIDSSVLENSADWMNEILGSSGTARDREILSHIARDFSEQSRPPIQVSEAALEQLILSSFPDQVFLIFTAASVDKRKKIFKAVEQKGRIVECAVPREKRGTSLDKSFFEDQIQLALQGSEKKINPRAMQLIYSRAGGDLRQLHAEVQKLLAFTGNRKEITVQDVQTVFDDSHETEFFEFINALRSADRAKLIPALHRNMRMVSHPLQTLAILANDVRKLMLARELLFAAFRDVWRPGITYDRFVPILRKFVQNDPSSKAKGAYNLLTMNEFALFNLLKAAQRFKMEKLLGIMESILEADMLLKSTRVGARSPQAILENVVYAICKPEAKL